MRRNNQKVERSESILRYVIDYKREHDGISPTIREIQEATGISSSSLVKFYLDGLQKRGAIQYIGDNLSRGIMVTGGEWKHG
jgi:SOS-response transcriptional repressor LexA